MRELWRFCRLFNQHPRICGGVLQAHDVVLVQYVRSSEEEGVPAHGLILHLCKLDQHEGWASVHPLIELTKLPKEKLM